MTKKELEKRVIQLEAEKALLEKLLDQHRLMGSPYYHKIMTTDPGPLGPKIIC